jgi:hypothetical protein
MKILIKQQYHLITLILLLIGVRLVFRGDYLIGSFLGLTANSWFWISVVIAILHQIYVVILWRAELYYQLLTKWFGASGFFVWGLGFIVLLLARPVSITGLAIANQGTADIPDWLGISLSIICMILLFYLGYSVLKYFGIKRAMGLDHFQPQVYKSLPMVKDGIFRWSSNSMYIFGFLLLWTPGLIFHSRTALLSALFSHLYIWVHYYFTEYPDMQFIYQIK